MSVKFRERMSTTCTFDTPENTASAIEFMMSTGAFDNVFCNVLNPDGETPILTASVRRVMITLNRKRVTYERSKRQHGCCPSPAGLVYDAAASCYIAGFFDRAAYARIFYSEIYLTNDESVTVAMFAYGATDLHSIARTLVRQVDIEREGRTVPHEHACQWQGTCAAHRRPGETRTDKRDT
jgi:hypothetical protein